MTEEEARNVLNRVDELMKACNLRPLSALLAPFSTHFQSSAEARRFFASLNNEIAESVKLSMETISKQLSTVAPEALKAEGEKRLDALLKGKGSNGGTDSSDSA